MDLWTARDAPVARIKVEPQLHVNNDWVIYPMEGRVMRAVVLEANREARDRRDAPVFEVMKGFLCRPGPVSELGASLNPPNVQSMRVRNAVQDLTLAKDAPRAELQALFGSCASAIPSDPEWYLRIRDYLLRLR